jgi:hypothetical protein
MLIVDSDDWSYLHDCRKQLEELKKINPAFKITLFTVPGKTTLEMLAWASNKDWIELAVHGWMHESNYECEHWSQEECDFILDIGQHYGFVKVFKAPGWQISDGCYQACLVRGFVVADQPYNEGRRLMGQKVYEVGDNSLHTHTWSCNCNNGIEEIWEEIVNKIKDETEFKFISEV